MGSGSCQARCSAKTQRRQTRATKVPSALREARARLPSHGLQCVTVTLRTHPLPPRWTVARWRRCWDSSRLPWERAGALPVKTQTPQSCCKINTTYKARGPAAPSRPTANRERGLEGMSDLACRWGKRPLVPGLRGSVHTSENHSSGLGGGGGGHAERGGLWGQEDWVQVQALAPASHPTVKRAPYISRGYHWGQMGEHGQVRSLAHAQYP